MLRSWLGFRKACLISSTTLSGQLTAEIQCWVSDETAKVRPHALREIQICDNDTTPNRFEKTTKAEFTHQKLAHMVTRDAKEYPEPIPSEIQGGRPLHFLRTLSWVPLLEYGTV